MQPNIIIIVIFALASVALVALLSRLPSQPLVDPTAIASHNRTVNEAGR